VSFLKFREALKIKSRRWKDTDDCWEMHIVYIHCDAVRGTLFGRGIISAAVITTNLCN
jgi:hypothetical protein